jgi:hypothetical protein
MGNKNCLGRSPWNKGKKCPQLAAAHARRRDWKRLVNKQRPLTAEERAYLKAEVSRRRIEKINRDKAEGKSSSYGPAKVIEQSAVIRLDKAIEKTIARKKVCDPTAGSQQGALSTALR